MQKPTVGRIVHFYQSDVSQSDIPHAAMIVFTYANDDSKTNLVVHSRWEGDFKGLLEKVEFSNEPKPDHWSWPPRM